MTVSSTESRISHAGDGTSLTFPGPFYFIEPGHLVVSLVEADGTILPWTLGHRLPSDRRGRSQRRQRDGIRRAAQW
ncbi:hypothetical protein [Pigmentiphaga humi]|uniref:hypothetical protein n=1 Tax=Pigmentiphaga humi TaxID=2478468 RepID=UPI000F5442E9|nr:hypothetical protein [Pigmentiphaga humi]